ncbi:MAG: GNAT family N-acetyltransferase [Gemmatimonadales bacterium]
MTAVDPGNASFVLETERLTLRRLDETDAEFILGLLNEPSFHQYIGDRGVRTEEDARAYIRNGPMASYEKFGFGLWLVLRKDDGAPIGICGLLKRDTLPDVDVGFALRPAFWGMGYALESAAGVLAHGREALTLPRVAAIVQADNQASIRLLGKLGLHFERRIEWPGDAAEIHLYARDLA